MSRSYTTGYVVKDRTKWRAVINWQGEDKRQRRLTKSTGIRCSAKKGDNRGKMAAEEFLRAWRDELILEGTDEGGAVESTTPLVEYCEHHLSLLSIKASTRSGYQSAIKKLVGTRLGELPICNVSKSDVAAWDMELIEGGLSTTTVAHYHAFVAQVLKSACFEEHIKKCPVEGLRAPRRRVKPTNSLTSEQRSEVLSKMDAIGCTPFSMGVRIALLTGMRRAEICALRWQDVEIDTDRPTIHVVHSLTKGKGFTMDTPKDPAGGDSRRDVPIGGRLRGYLLELRSQQEELLREFGSGLDGTLFVIGNPLNGAFKNPEMLGREWKMLALAEGWRGTQGESPRFHDLRHTFATLAIKDRVMDIMSLSKILGHRDVSTTLNIYADALEESKRAGMEALDATL